MHSNLLDTPKKEKKQQQHILTKLFPPDFWEDQAISVSCKPSLHGLRLCGTSSVIK